jgi:hypothetical protein
VALRVKVSIEHIRRAEQRGITDRGKKQQTAALSREERRIGLQIERGAVSLLFFIILRPRTLVLSFRGNGMEADTSTQEIGVLW